MTARQIDGHWYCDFRAEGKRYRVRSLVNTKREAEAYERKLRERLANGKSLREMEEVRDEQTVESFLREWLDVYVSTENKPSERATKESIIRMHLIPFFGNLGLTDVTEEKLSQFKARQKRLYKGKTINNHLTVLRKALVTAKAWKRIPVVPSFDWCRVERTDIRYLTREESERLLAVAEGDEKILVEFELKSGVRRGEALAVRWADINFDAAVVHIRRSVWKGNVGTPKNHKARFVDLSPDLVASLRAHRDRQQVKSEYVFCNAQGGMLTPDQIKRVLPRLCAKAGLPPIQWHGLRHSFASQLVMNSVPMRTVQELLGHADIQMTMRYAHVAPSARREAVATLDGPKNSGQPVGSEQEGSS